VCSFHGQLSVYSVNVFVHCTNLNKWNKWSEVFVFFCCCRCQMESNDKHWEAAILRRAVASQQTAHGKTSWLSLQVYTVTRVYTGISVQVRKVVLNCLESHWRINSISSPLPVHLAFIPSVSANLLFHSRDDSNTSNSVGLSGSRVPEARVDGTKDG